MSFDPVSYLMGKAAGGGGGSGGGDTSYGEPILRNWDFTNPLNTRGQTVYTGSVGTINGWKQTATTKCELVSGGIKISANGGNTNMYFSLKIGKESYYSGKTMTLSLMANNKVMSSTFTIDTTKIRQGEVWLDSMNLWFNRDSSSSYVLGFYNTGAGDDTLIQAVKLEFGSVSTLCDVESGVATLRRHQVAEEETLFLSLLGANN